MPKSSKPDLKLILANPRGFCAGVDRAVQIVLRALERYGAPVYVRHEIVHNQRVIDELSAKGVVFVDELSEIPENMPVIFSAHGVARHVPEDARRRNLHWLDATCPLVSKVHIEAARHYENNTHILLIGHAYHPEVVGTMGQLPNDAMCLIETKADAETIMPPAQNPPAPLAYLTQTTLSVDDTAEIIAILKARFPDIIAPHKQDICYATTNRQDGVKELAAMVDFVLVIGANNSSNAQRLVETAQRIKHAQLIGDANDIEWDAMCAHNAIGITAGASAPETLVQEVVAAFQTRFNVQMKTQAAQAEQVHFKLPPELRDAPPQKT